MGSGGKNYNWIWIGAGIAVIIAGLFIFIPFGNQTQEPITEISKVTPPEPITAAAIRNDLQTAAPTPNASIEETNLTELSAPITRDQPAVLPIQKEPAQETPLQKAPIPSSNDSQKIISAQKESQKETNLTQLSTSIARDQPAVLLMQKESQEETSLQKETIPSETPTSQGTGQQTAEQKQPESMETEGLSNQSISRIDKPKEDKSAQKERLKPTPIAKSILPAIDYNQLDRDPALQALMEKRKKQLGIDGGVDIIARMDESIKIGDQVIPMKEIIDQIRIKQGGIVEKNLSATETTSGQKPITTAEIFGIHVVQPGENIWNIHFTLLKNYFAHQGVDLPLRADEPLGGGQSSGVGKLLKFSENIVYIYNIRERKLSDNLDQIIPLTKIVIYNMERIFSLLDQIDYKNLNRIRFDGVTVWIPS